MSDHPTVSVVGAGIGGLCAALALQQRGYSPRLYEAAPELGDVGAGLSLPPNAVRALDSLGLHDFLREHANEPLDQNVHHYRSGEDLIAIDRRNVRDEYGAPYLQLHRADLHGELVRRVRQADADALHVGHEMVGLEIGDGGAALRFANGAEADSRLVVGADGLKSRVREILFDATGPEFTGHIAWRGVVPAAAVDDWFTEPGSHTWAGAGRLLVHYPMRGRELVNYVGFTRSVDWAEEGWSIPADVEELRDALHDFHPRVHDLLRATPAERCFKWGLFARGPLSSWSQGPVTLLGDAAHPMLPYFGLGAGMAIEDAVILARALAERGSATEAFAAYEKARLERTSFIQAEANLGGDRLQRTDTEQLGKEKPRNEDALGVFHYDAATVPI